MKEGGFNKLQKRVRGRFSDMVFSFFLHFLPLLIGMVLLGWDESGCRGEALEGRGVELC